MRSTLIRLTAILLGVVCVGSVIFYFLAGDGFFHPKAETSALSEGMYQPLRTSDDELSQSFTCEYKSLVNLSFYVRKQGAPEGTLSVVLMKEDKSETYYSDEIRLASLPSNGRYCVVFSQPLADVLRRRVTLVLSCDYAQKAGENFLSFAAGNTVNGGKGFSIDAEIGEKDALTVNGEKVMLSEIQPDNSVKEREVKLCFTFYGEKNDVLAKLYWPAVAVIFAALSAYCANLFIRDRKQKKSAGLNVIRDMKKYKFLLGQMVARDFKTKYKRSVLGVLWSVLNPLLIMMVQYFVFSNLFKSNIAFYAAYLCTGIVCFNFMTDACHQCLVSITGNARLITKVSVPKYLYPFSKSLSAAINFLFSLIPLTIVIFASGVTPSWSQLLFPLGFFMLFLFSYGIGQILASLMVFFRDMQFLWNIITTLWMYLTPIFYSETIIPARFLTLYKCNPMYHYIRFMRTILIDGVSPEPQAYLFCLIFSLAALLIGTLVFKKTENKFVNNI